MKKTTPLDLDIKNFMNKVKTFEKNEKLDLSSGEDLSIAIMNLISIEEHLFFSAQKTGQDKYLEILNETRNIRKSLLKKIVKDSKGEVWCISKHLLASSMRLMEVGTKYLGKKQNQEAQEMFTKSYQLYNLFWAVNLKLVNLKDLKNQDSSKIHLLSENDQVKPKEISIFNKFGQFLQKILDCCRE